MRENIDTIHSKWFKEAEEMCQSVEVEVKLPRLCGRQRHRENIPAQTPSDYYRRTVTIPVLDHLISQMKSRFTEHQRTALLGLNLIPSILVAKQFDELEDTPRPLEALYLCDLQDGSFLTELHQWYLK